MTIWLRFNNMLCESWCQISLSSYNRECGLLFHALCQSVGYVLVQPVCKQCIIRENESNVIELGIIVKTLLL